MLPRPTGSTPSDLCQADNVLALRPLTPSVIFGLRGHPRVSSLGTSEQVSERRRIVADTQKLNVVAIQPRPRSAFRLGDEMPTCSPTQSV
jgi:hypothetical protein